MTEQPRVIDGHGAWRITIQGGGVVKFECWEINDEGDPVAYYHAP